MLVIEGIRNWHYEVSLSLQLVDSFVKGVEKQAAESIQTYRAYRDNGTLEMHIVSDNRDLDAENKASDSIETSPASRRLDVHLGLDSETWDLNELFEEHFPSLHRRSALLTLWGFAEYELHKLCLLYQSEKSLENSIFDQKGKGIDRSTDYLEKVAGLKNLKSSQEWRQLKDLQQIRNVVAHNDGRLNGRHGKPKSAVMTATKKIGYVKGDNELVIEEGLLSKTLNIFSSYFSVIDRAIKHSHQSSKP